MATGRRFAKFWTILVVAGLLGWTRSGRADEKAFWITETLDNGLQVIYAPLPSSPVVQVRVEYHVGSKDERPDRQGFAHMFEHMMFRGSAHVAPQEHMKLINLVGGSCNAFTSFDQTVYHDTLPATSVEMALWLEADRMASFKVSPEIYRTERLVVAEEWRWRRNTPYGELFEELLPEVYKAHSYRWTPMGDMGQLLASTTSELQAFFNKYYVPNNAVLVISGNIDLPKVKEEVHQYFGWIPRGAAIERLSPAEPPQSEARRKEISMRVPLSRLVLAYHLPPITSDDQDALGVMLAILGQGQSSRVSQALVTNKTPSCVSAEAWGMALENSGVMALDATLLKGADVAAVEKALREQAAAMIASPVTAEELEKAKQETRLELAKRWETVESTASKLGDEMLYRGNLDRIPTERARLEAITAADVQRVAAKHLNDSQSSVLIINPGNPEPVTTYTAATQSATQPIARAAPRNVQFPADYPTTPPASGKIPTATFDKGVETKLGPDCRLIVMEENRLPIVNWSIVIRAGGHSAAPGKEGLAGLTAAMLMRGPKGKTYEQFSDELESRGITLSVSDGGDITRIDGSCLKEDVPFALAETRDMLTLPAFDPGEFTRLVAQSANGLALELNDPQTVASQTLSHALYGEGPRGRFPTPDTLKGISLDDVKKFYESVYHAGGAIVVLWGDVTAPDGQKMAEQYFGAWASAGGTVPTATYPPIAALNTRRIILVDAPMAKQSSIRLGWPAYDLHSGEKPAGLLAGQMLSNGIESRLNKYVRAEKGYVYNAEGYFEPNRQNGIFAGETDTKFETTTDTIQAMFKVFDDMKTQPIPEQEVADARFRVAGQLVMSLEKINDEHYHSDQAGRRIEAILDGYPIDYYDTYPERLSKVTPDALQALMNKYVDESRMVIVVAAPAEKVKAQLEKLGTVEVVPMPLAGAGGN